VTSGCDPNSAVQWAWVHVSDAPATKKQRSMSVRNLPVKVAQGSWREQTTLDLNLTN
jgi:hypothetical protein